MKLKSKLVIVSAVLICCVGCALFLRFGVEDPIEQIAQTVLENPNSSGKAIPPDQMTPDLANFLGWYKLMVADASPEVRAVMKRFDAKYRSGWANRNEEIERWYPTDEWLQRFLDMGIAIDNYSDYTSYLSNRWIYYHAQNEPESISDLKYQYGLDDDASWDELLDAGTHFIVKLQSFANQAMDADPLVYGGSMGKDEIFIPMRLKTVYVRNGSISYGSGVPEWVGRELGDREAGLPPSREIPDDIDIIYLDEKGQPIKDRMPPSLGDGGETPKFHSSETVGESVETDSLSVDDFDNSFPDDLPPSDTEPYEFEKPNLPQNVADLEKQFSPESIETELSELLSPDRFENAQQLIDQYGTEEGLRRFREMDPEAAQRFERDRRPTPNREVPDEVESSTQ